MRATLLERALEVSFRRTAKIGMLWELFPNAEVVADDDKNHGIIRFDLEFASDLPEGQPLGVWRSCDSSTDFSNSCRGHSEVF